MKLVTEEQVRAAEDDELDTSIEATLRTLIAWARARAAVYRESDPIVGRASAIIATHLEDALLRLKYPVP